MAKNKHGTNVCTNCNKDGAAHRYSGTLNDSTTVTCTNCGFSVQWNVVKP